jgi:hypothetical protein
VRLPKGPRVKVKVTKEKIQDAVRGDSSHCMIAESLKEAVPFAKSVSVDMASIRFSDPARGLRYMYMTPRSAQLCLVDFDQGKPPEPFEFTIYGAHVVRMNRQSKHAAKSPPQKKAEARQRLHDTLAKSRLVVRAKGLAPEVVGGRLDPSGSFAKRRAFGIRLLGRSPAELSAE